MALIAKEQLWIGFTLAANPGNLVSPDAVKAYGWGDKVEDDGQDEKPKRAKAESAAEAEK